MSGFFDSIIRGYEAARADYDFARPTIENIKKVDITSAKYVSVRVKTFYMPMVRMGTSQVIPLIAGKLSFSNELDRERVINKDILSVPQNAGDAEARNYVIGALDGLNNILIEGSNLNIEIVMSILPTRDIAKEAIELVSEIVKSIPSGAAAVPYMSLLAKSRDVFNSIVTFGINTTVLMGDLQVNFNTEAPEITAWIAPRSAEEGGRRDEDLDNRFKFDNDRLMLNGSEYRDSAYIVFEYKYWESHPALDSLPIASDILNDILFSLENVSRSNDSNLAHEAVRLALLNAKQRINKLNYLSRDDRQRVYDDIVKELEKSFNDKEAIGNIVNNLFGGESKKTEPVLKPDFSGKLQPTSDSADPPRASFELPQFHAAIENLRTQIAPRMKAKVDQDS